MIWLKRIARFLVGKALLWTCFRWRTSGSRLYAYMDANWASCKGSMSGGMLVHSGSLLRFWSWKPKVSRESELYAGVTEGVDALGLQSGLADFGIRCQATLMSDNRRVVDHTARQGLEVAKHIHVRHLWLQTARESGQRDVRKVHTSRIAANVLTKALPFGEIRDLCRKVKVIYDGDVLADSNRCAWNVGKGHRPSLPPRERDIMGQPNQCNKPKSSMGAHTSCRCGGGRVESVA